MPRLIGQVLLQRSGQGLDLQNILWSLS